MNRLVLIGNGFDLAHGMKTGYSDFLLAYLKTAFQSASNGDPYNDGLLSVSAVDIEYPYHSISYYNEKLIDYLYENSQLKNYLDGTDVAGSDGRPLERHFETEIHFDFFRKLISHCSHADWTGIENEFYSELQTFLAMDSDPKKKGAIDKLNACMELVISQLEKYLCQLPKPPQIAPYVDILAGPIFERDIVSLKMDQDRTPEKTVVLNFNYTPTAEYYLAQNKPGKETPDYTINYIHGKLGDKENPIVFGFGDELDSQYKKMENSKVKGFLKYIKSFWYFRTTNYHELIRFLDSDTFQVYTLGHSCGLSDRTMLNMIFEHANCKSIKVFYYGTKEKNNFVDITEEISRHFESKAAMRKRIVPLTRSSRMPQSEDENLGFENDVIFP